MNKKSQKPKKLTLKRDKDFIRNIKKKGLIKIKNKYQNKKRSESLWNQSCCFYFEIKVEYKT